MRTASSLASGLVVSGLLLATAPTARHDTAADLAQARALLEHGDPKGAIAKAEEGLELDESSVELLDLASRAAAHLDDGDLCLWYTSLALEAAQDDPQYVKAIPDLRARFQEHDLVSSQGKDYLRKFETFTAEALKLGRSCANRKYYVNAADLFLQCRGTRFEASAEHELDKLYENKDARTALAESKMPLRDVTVSKSKARMMAAQDRKHTTWATRYNRETPNYVIETDVSYEVMEKAAYAMETMGRFYKKIFSHQGRATKCSIKLYRSREEFEVVEGGSKGSISSGIRGFFVPAQNYVATYFDENEQKASGLDVWTTLFHEASHQYTREISKGTIPAWMNEGTASYFEGARLYPNGDVSTNDIPEGRLRHLHAALNEGRPAVRAVVEYFQPGSYPGEYYSFGWGLVYFMHNYENESCERVYVPIYKQYVNSYRKEERHDPFERFVEFFVRKAKQPGIETFEQFEEHWKHWIFELYERYFGPPERADDWIARARQQVAYKQLEPALESYRYALRKRSTDLVALFEQADVFARLKLSDGAIMNYRKLLSLLRKLDPGALVPGLEMSNGDLKAETIKRLSKLDGPIAASVQNSADGFAELVAEAATTYHEAGFPRMALRMLQDAVQLLDGDVRLEELHGNLMAESGVDVRRWHRLRVQEQLDAWRASDAAKAKDGGIEVKTAGIESTMYSEPLPTKYFFEAKVRRLAGDQRFSLCGLTFASKVGEGPQALCLGPGSVALFTGSESLQSAEVMLLAPAPEGDEAVLGIAVTPEKVRLFLNGELVGEKEYGEGELIPRVGLFVANSSGYFSEIRARY